MKHGELTPFYQLQREAGSGVVSGFEVLLRWNHPKRGIVMSGEFIALTEESGLIVPIGAWVLEQACQQAKEWVDAGQSDLTVAVNLSARQFQQPDLAKQVADILEKTGLPAKYLELEITENLLLQHSDQNSAVLQELHELGICLALDDFGTGYSSLSYLKKFPFDRLKIDQSFVRNLPDSHEDAALIDAIITLGLEIIAEGVENEAQLAFLRNKGCDLIQGYLFSKPLPAEKAALFL
ncbi:MAG: EAL domain-containing protein [Gammaproteobacteria bacterium]|nr:EAL domain-containing protein [Gammaproteobacteria bacterium]